MENCTGVFKEIEQRLMAVTEVHIAAVPLPKRTPHTIVTAERVGRRIRCLRAVKEAVENECQILAEGGALDWKMKHAFREIIEQILDLEVWRQYPALADEDYVLYSDWSVGPGPCKVNEIKTGLVSTRTADVGGVLHFNRPLTVQ